MSVSADTGSVTDAGYRKPVGGAFSYASSMTSGDIHIMAEGECKPHNVKKEVDEPPFSDLARLDKVQTTLDNMVMLVLDYTNSCSQNSHANFLTIRNRREAILADSKSDFLCITTGKPPNFKGPIVQKEISRHVMKDYQNKQQSGKEFSHLSKSREFAKPQSDEEAGFTATNALLSAASLKASLVHSTLTLCFL